MSSVWVSGCLGVWEGKAGAVGEVGVEWRILGSSMGGRFGLSVECRRDG